MRSVFEVARSFLPRSPKRQLDLEEDILEELQFHLDCLTESNEQCGMAIPEARAAALKQFGNPEEILEACVDARDLHPGRRLARLTARVLPLGLSVGFATAVLIVLYAVVVRLPATYPPEGKWVVLWWEHEPTGLMSSDSSIEDFEAWRAQSKLAESVELGSYSSTVSATADSSERLLGKYVAYDYLEQHGIRPVIGRVFDAGGADDTIRPVVISYNLWQRRFDGSTAALGSKLDVGGVAHSIVGVTPAGYQTYYPFDFFAPMDMSVADRTTRRYLASARLKPGVSVQEAEAEFDAIATTGSGDEGWHVRVRKPQVVYGGDYPRRMLPYGILSLMLLAVAIVKGRASARTTRRLSLPSLLIGTTSVGVITAYATIEMFRATVLSGADQRFNFGVDFPILFAFVALVLLCVLATVRTRKHTLKAGDVATTGTHELSPGLILTNVLAFLMLVSAMTFTADWWQRRNPDVGFDIDRVFTVPLLLSDSEFPDRAAGREFFRLLIDRLDSSSVIEQYSFSNGFPTLTDAQGVSVILPGQGGNTKEDWTRIATRAVGPDYFETIGIKTVAGHPFEPLDGDSTLGRAVINAAMAARYWPDGSAIGRRLDVYGVRTRFQVTAVVENSVSSEPGDETEPMLYPLIWHWTRPGLIVVRTAANFQHVAGEMRRIVRGIHPGAALGMMRPGDFALRRAAEERLMLVLFLWASAFLALALSSSFTFRSVHRTVESGVRVISLRGKSRWSSQFAFRSLLSGVALSLIVGGLLSPSLSSILLEEMIPDARMGALCVALPALLVIGIHFLVAYLPFRQYARLAQSSASPRR